MSSYMPMPPRADTHVQFSDLSHAVVRCRRCGLHRDVPLDREKSLVENYRDFAIARRAFDERHATCPEKDHA